MAHQEFIHDGQGPGYPAVLSVSAVTSGIVTMALLWFSGVVSLPLVGRFKDGEVLAREIVMVPQLIGLPASAGAELLRGRNLRLLVTKERSSLTEAKGTIIEQLPLPDSQLKSDNEVKVIVSSGPGEAVVPNLIGQTLEEARQACDSVHIEIGDVSQSGEGEPGTVTKVIPPPESTVKEGSKVSLIMAPDAVAMPKLVNMGLKKAKEEIEKLGLTVGKIQWRYSDYIREYAVISHSPEEGEPVSPGTKVDLVVCPEE